MMMIFFDQICIIVFPKQQVWHRNKFGIFFCFGPHLLRNWAHMQNYNLLKKLCLVYFFKSEDTVIDIIFLHIFNIPQ